MTDIAIRARISGRVQGVGYRAWTERRATALGLAGWVRNREDGTVELLAAGDADAVRALLEACREGPAFASVDAVKTTAEDGADPEIGARPGFRQIR